MKRELAPSATCWTPCATQKNLKRRKDSRCKVNTWLSPHSRNKTTAMKNKFPMNRQSHLIWNQFSSKRWSKSQEFRIPRQVTIPRKKLIRERVLTRSYSSRRRTLRIMACSYTRREPLTSDQWLRFTQIRWTPSRKRRRTLFRTWKRFLIAARPRFIKLTPVKMAKWKGKWKRTSKINTMQTMCRLLRSPQVLKPKSLIQIS